MPETETSQPQNCGFVAWISLLFLFLRLTMPVWMSLVAEMCLGPKSRSGQNMGRTGKSGNSVRMEPSVHTSATNWCLTLKVFKKKKKRQQKTTKPHMFQVHVLIKVNCWIPALCVLKVKYWILSFLLGLCPVAWQQDKKQQGWGGNLTLLIPEVYFDQIDDCTSGRSVVLMARNASYRRQNGEGKAIHGIGVAQKEKSAHS